MRNSHRRWYLHVVVNDLIGAWNGELIDDAVYFSTLAHDLIDLLRINSDVLIRRSGAGRSERSLAQRERVMDGLGDLHRVTHWMNVHIHHPWRLLAHMGAQ